MTKEEQVLKRMKDKAMTESVCIVFTILQGMLRIDAEIASYNKKKAIEVINKRGGRYKAPPKFKDMGFGTSL